MKKFGEFKNDGWEYHIYRPDTPKPWFNYLFNNNYHALISQTGGGFSYALDPKVNRLLRYDNIDNDLSGRYLFFKENNKIWSANWQPLKNKYEKWKTIFSPGYVKINSIIEKIKVEMLFFVPLDETVTLWKVKIKNIANKKRNLSIYPFIDVIAGDIDLEVRYKNIMKLYNISEYDKKSNSLIFYKMKNSAREIENYTFFTSLNKFNFFETRRLNFVGEYHTIETPIGLKQKKLSNSTVRGEDMVGLFQFNINLEPGEEKEFGFIIGFSEDKNSIRKLQKKYKRIENINNEYLNTINYWKEVLQKVWIKTPDKNINIMANIWGKYQLLAITRWRGTSAYHGTEGGLGYRDLAQDIEGIISLDKELALEKLTALLMYQYNNGDAVSGFSSLEGAWDLNAENKFVSGKADVAVWLPNAVFKYIKETGNIKFLDRKVKFFDKGEATVFEHIVRAVRHIYNTKGRHSLPLIKIADWNDAYDRVGVKNKGESIWLGEALCWAALIVKDIAEIKKDKKIIKEMEKIYNNMKKNINKYGWYKNHYIAAYNDEGRKIGDKNIPLNSQTWAIIGRVVDNNNRLKNIINAIDSLDTPYGNLLFKPPYKKYDSGIGRVTAFAPGTKENGAIFSHAVAFKIVADYIINRNDMAYKSILKLLPMSKYKSNLEKYKVEPFVWAEYVIGKGNKYYGEGAFTWNTGTAVWMYVAITEWLLGVKPDINGLKLKPNLPSNWKKAFIKRVFRNTLYEIYIIKAKEKKLIIDGETRKDSFIPYFNDNKTHKVEFYY